MVSKKSDSPDVLDTQKSGYRHCPACGKWSKGPKNTTCLNKKCGKPLPPPASSGKGKSIAKQPKQTAAAELLAKIEQVNAMGGLSVLKSKVEATQKAMAELSVVGGVLGGQDLILTMETLSKAMK
jgi:hypothetical protein